MVLPPFVFSSVFYVTIIICHWFISFVFGSDAAYQGHYHFSRGQPDTSRFTFDFFLVAL